VIRRDPVHAAAQEHDLVIVGGGIQGACLALESARRGLRPLLLERGDFGEATSWNTLRIVHGGLRYLQTLDLARFRDSVRERRWFCRAFPHLVRPQECLMPLYGDGLKRPAMLRAALLVNDLMSYDRNAGVPPEHWLPRGRLLSASQTVARFPQVERRGLRGAGVWYDLAMHSSQRILIEMLRWACSLGATVLNYVEATGVRRRGAVLEAVDARDAIDGRSYIFSSRVVCNCAGPWSADLASRLDRPIPELFQPSLAFNVLLDRQPPSTAAVAVSPRRNGGAARPVYFAYPAFGRLLVGTVHLPWHGTPHHPEPDEAQVAAFLGELNDAIPGLDARLDHVVRVFAGLLPVVRSGTAALSVRPVVRDHGRHGGPRGLFSVSGVKFTTARLVAERALGAMSRELRQPSMQPSSDRPPSPGALDFDRAPAGPLLPEQTRSLERLAREESVMTLDDLLYRRTNWALTEPDLVGLRRRVSDALGGQLAAARGCRAPEERRNGTEAPAWR
jgi:glycerol-3-phosphate dehydrogenase